MKSKSSTTPTINCVSKLLLISLAGTLALSISSVSAAFAQDAAAGTSMEKPIEFVVVFDAPADAHNAWNSDAVVAHLKNDLVLNGRLAASAGAVVRGHVEPIDRKGDVLSRQSAKGKALSSSMPFRIVFDEIVSSRNRSLKMHAVPSNQYSMLNQQIRLQEGDELVVKIGQMKNSGKQKMLEPIADSGVAETISDAADSASSNSASSNSASSNSASNNSASNKATVNSSSPSTSGSSVSSLNSNSPGMWSSSLDSISPQGKSKSLTLESDKAGSNDPAPERANGAAPEISSKTDSVDKNASKTADVSDTKNGGDTVNSEKLSNNDAAGTSKNSLELSPVDLNAKPGAGDAVAVATPPRIKGKSKEFRIAFKNPVFTKNARVGDKAQATLLEDMKIRDNLIAKKGDSIYGHVVALRSSRHWGGAIAASSERFQRDAGITIVFTKIVTASGERISIDGRIPQQLSVFNNQGVYKRVTVGETGEVIKDEAVDDGSESATAVSKDILKMGATAMMGPAAAIATPLIMMGAMVKAEPLMLNSFQKTFISKGAEVYIAAGDEVVVQARLASPDSNQKAVSGKVIAGKSSKQKLASRRSTSQ